MKRNLLVSFLVLSVLLFASAEATAQSLGPATPQTLLGPGFTYQGQLKNAGGPVNGACDMQFSLWDAAGSGSPPTGGTQIGATQTLSAVMVTNGLFTVVLNSGNQFGSNAFTGDARWLQIAVRCPAGSGAYATLSPRQAVTATPYALSLMPNATIKDLNNTGNLSFGMAMRQMVNLWGSLYGIGIQNRAMYFRADKTGGFAWFEGGSHSDVQGDPGPDGKVLMTLNSNAGLAVPGKVTASTNSGTGATLGQTAVGVLGEATGTGTGIQGRNLNALGYGVYSVGNFAVAPGFTKSAIVHTGNYGDRKLYAVESPGNWFEDFGSWQLQQGKATVTIDPIFAQTVNLAETYHVFLTPLGDCVLYVSEKTQSSFTVKAASGGLCNVGFDFRIVAKRLGFEDVRLEPAPARTSR